MYALVGAAQLRQRGGDIGAVGGTAVAGSELLVTGANVQNGSLTGVDVRTGSLGARTLSPAALRALKG